MKYGLLIYEYAHMYCKGYDDGVTLYNYPEDYTGSKTARPESVFDSVAKDADFWPNYMNGYIGGRNGQETPHWGDENVVPYVIAKSEIWTQEMTDAINDSITAWNDANPNNQFNASQVIFDQEERGLIASQLLARQQEIIAAYGQQ
jgi:hypothetical protein